jgi:hypothetical protein
MIRAWILTPLFMLGLGCATLEIAVDVYDGPLIMPTTEAQALSVAVSSSGLCHADTAGTFHTDVVIFDELDELRQTYVELQSSSRMQAHPAREELEKAKKTLAQAKQTLAQAEQDLAQAQADGKPASVITTLQKGVETASSEVGKKTNDVAAKKTALGEARAADQEQLPTLWCASGKQATECSKATSGAGYKIFLAWKAGPAKLLETVCKNNEVLVQSLADRRKIEEHPPALENKLVAKLVASDKQIAMKQDLLEQSIAHYEGALPTFIRESIVAHTSQGDVTVDAPKQIELAGVRLDADRASGIATEGPVTGRVAGYPLFDSLFIQVLRNSKPGMPDPNLYWTPMSRTRSRASGGNNQFVMIRQGLLVFHQKSLDFDPTPIIGAASASARLGIKIAAQLASGATGVPLPIPGDGGDEQQPAAEPLPASEVDTELLRQRVELRDEAERETLRELAGLLEDLDALAENDEEGRADILKRMNSIIRRYQGKIDKEL